MKIAVLYGTETGNAEMLAEDVQAGLEAAHDVTCANLADTDPTTLASDTFYLLICSTYGDGELPTSAQPFVAQLEAAAPDLTQICFAIFGLGDSEYEDTFNGGSATLAAAMLARGALQIGARQTHDASGPDMAEDLALPWAEAVIEEAASRFGEAA